MDTLARAGAPKALTSSQIEDLRLAASKMNGVERRGFQAEMALKYCKGSARLAETVFGFGGYLCANYARTLEPRLIRSVVMVVAFSMTIYFFIHG